jgi:hypothetical protein
VLLVATRNWSGSSLAFPAVVLPPLGGPAVRIRAAGPPRGFADDSGSRQLAAATKVNTNEQCEEKDNESYRTFCASFPGLPPLPGSLVSSYGVYPPQTGGIDLNGAPLRGRGSTPRRPDSSLRIQFPTGRSFFEPADQGGKGRVRLTGHLRKRPGEFTWPFSFPGILLHIHKLQSPEALLDLSSWNRPHHAIHQFPIAEDQESRNAENPIAGRNFRVFIGIKLADLHPS